jgi:hypothetical protein
VAYVVDLPVTFEGRQYMPGDIVYLSETEAASLLEPLAEPQAEPAAAAVTRSLPADAARWLLPLPERASKLEKQRYETFNVFLAALGPTDKVTVFRIQELLQHAPSLMRISDEGAYLATVDAMQRTITKLIQPQPDTVRVHSKPDRFEVVSTDAQGQVLAARTVTKDTFKYRVLRPVELHGKSCQPGDVIEAAADDVQQLLQDGTVMATCYWSCSGDFSSAGYSQQFTDNPFYG